MINFLQISDKLPYPASNKADLSTKHTEIIDYAISNYDGSFSFRRKITHLMNLVSYHVLENNTSALHLLSSGDPFLIESYDVDEDILKSKLGKMYLQDKQIDWRGLTPVQNVSPTVESNDDGIPENISSDVETPSDFKPIATSIKSTTSSKFDTTDKSDLYIQYPIVPRFDTSKVIARGVVDSCEYRVYYTEPAIPTRQCEISATTDINLMSDSDFYKLYPKQFIRTRSPNMYVPQVNMGYHDKLGAIFPVSGYSESQVLDNIVRYPHLYKMFRNVNGNPVTMYRDIEINGELYPISDVWKELPESNVIPYNVDFMKEYVVRRYLLERDIGKVEHRYPIWGEFGEFLTLITTPKEYSSWGYKDTLEMAKTCVSSRVNLKISRNPVLRRLNLV